jgi:hypothetical protein
MLLVGSLLTAGVMIYTANQGRQIRHPEIAFHSGGLTPGVDSTHHPHGCMLGRRSFRN